MSSAIEKTYTVRGLWPFPTDMLRHDVARAASPDDDAAIARLSQDHAPDRAALRSPVSITLVSAYKPNTARWESFGWSVPSDASANFIRRLIASSAKRRALAEAALAKLSDEERSAVAWFYTCHGGH